VVGNPTASNGEFIQWADSVQALDRYPELQGFGESVIVPASQLPAFARRAVLDPTGPLAANGTFEVVPPGDRPFSCLSTSAQSRSAQAEFPAGFDFCSGNLGTVSLAARDSGQSAYLPIQNGTSTLLSVLTPVYRAGALPVTTTARRAAFVGWVGMELLPKVVLDRALVGHGGTAVTMSYRANSPNAVFRDGPVPSGGRSVSVNLHNGWTVQTSGTVEAHGV